MHAATLPVLAALASSAHAQICLNPTTALPGDALAGDLIGAGIAVSGDRVLIGAPGDDDVGGMAGSALVYHRLGTDWVFEMELHPVGGGSGDTIGWSVALLNEVAVLGAPGDDDAAQDAGAAYVLRYDNNLLTWIVEAKLLPTDANPQDAFGVPVAISADRIIVGAAGDDTAGTNAGAAYIFHHAGGQWVLEAKLLAADANPNEAFGASVDISGTVAVVGCPDDQETAGRGSAYVYRFDGSTWNLEQKIVPGDLTFAGRIGSAVAAFNDLLLIADGEDKTKGVGAGAAYIYRYDGSAWLQEAKLFACDAAPGDSLGWHPDSVSLTQDTAMIGATLGVDGQANHSGAVYLFRYTGTEWTQLEKLTPESGESGERFGTAVSIQNATMAVGAPRRANQRGLATIFDITDDCCPPDLTGNGIVDADDYFLFLDLFQAGDLAADITGDCIVDGDDFFAYLDLFAQGC